VSLTPATVAQIAARSPNLVGIKHASSDLEFITRLLSELGPEFRIFCGLRATIYCFKVSGRLCREHPLSE
jgi:dihydrodipicolinate synthase/N-acetylneuraminate lyase